MISKFFGMFARPERTAPNWFVIDKYVLCKAGVAHIIGQLMDSLFCVCVSSSQRREFEMPSRNQLESLRISTEKQPKKGTKKT